LAFTLTPLLCLLGCQVELLGANIAGNGSREQMSYNIDCLRSQAPAALELLCDCVINPAFLPWELQGTEDAAGHAAQAPKMCSSRC